MFYYVLCFHYVLYFYYISVCRINPIQKGAAHRLHPFFNHKPYVYFIFISLPQNHQRAISLQKVHLWMEISADCPNRGRRSLAKMDRLRNVQSSVWTLQQILPDKLTVTLFFYHIIAYRIKPIQKRCSPQTTPFLSGKTEPFKRILCSPIYIFLFFFALANPNSRA